MAVSLRTSVTPITTGPAGIYHFTTQIVFKLFIVGIGITIQLHYPRLESTAFLSYSAAPKFPMDEEMSEPELILSATFSDKPLHAKQYHE
jgi:hypothetical protein